MIFLRPYFLLLLIVPFLFWVKSKKTWEKNSWATVCDPHLLPYITVDINGEHKKFYAVLMGFLWSLATVALAGPAILQENAATVSAQSGLVVVADMSPVSDERTIQKFIHKIYDLADSKKDTAVGLVLTDKQAYVALPLTQDADILKTIAAQLKEKNIMPALGQNIPAGIDRATALLKQSGFQKGQILVMLAGIDDTAPLLEKVGQTPYPVFFIGVNDDGQKKPVLLPDGSFWNNGKLYGLSDMSQAFSTNFTKASIDDSDLKDILSHQQLEMLENQTNGGKNYTDFGVWIVVLLIPFVVLLFRKGVLFMLAFMLVSSDVFAGMWQRTEQQDYQTQMDAVHAFNAKDYEQALHGFSTLAEIDNEALYNMGNTLAFMGKFEQAIQTYERVLQNNPNHQDAAFNLEYLKKQMPPAPEQTDQEQNEEQQNQSAEQQQQSASQQEQNTRENQDNHSNDTQSEQQNPQQQEQSVDEQDSEQKQTPQTEQSDEQIQKTPQQEYMPQESPEKQTQQEQLLVPANEQKQKEFLDKINPDAGRVLRYRLRQQYGVQQ